MKKRMPHILTICLLLATLLSACTPGDDAQEEPEKEQTSSEKTDDAPLNEYGITDAQERAFVRIYKKYQKEFMENYMERVDETDPSKLFEADPVPSRYWVSTVADLADKGTYTLEDIKAYTETLEHYKDGYVFEHTVIEWMETEHISDEEWKQLMDNHIMGEMDFMENVMIPAYRDVYEELIEK